MTTDELNQLRDEIHKNAVDHGWWDEDRPDYECCFLAITELAELFECYRKGTLDHQCDKPIPLTNLQEELADFAIRILDLAGARNIRLIVLDRTGHGEENPTIAYAVWCASTWATQYVTVEDKSLYASMALVQAIETARIIGKFDLWDAVRIKHEYNKTRPYRHGGLKA